MKTKIIILTLIIIITSLSTSFGENGIISMETFFDIGIKLYNERCYPEAIELFKKSMSLEETDACGLFLAKSYINNYQYSLGIIELKKIISRNPENKEAKELLGKYLTYHLPLEYYKAKIGSSEEEVKSKLKGKFLVKEDYDVPPKGIDVFIYDINSNEKATFKFKNNQLYEINVDFNNNNDFIKKYGTPLKKYLYYKDDHQQILADIWEDNIGQIIVKNKQYISSKKSIQSLTIIHKSISEEVEFISKQQHLNIWY